MFRTFQEIEMEIKKGNGLTKVFLDYDGTLVSLVSQPELAIPDKSLLTLLISLKKRIPLYLVTGRDLDGILSLVGKGFNIIAMHGSQYIDEEGHTWQIDHFDDFVKRTSELSQRYRYLEKDFPGLRVMDKKGGLQFHYYNVEEKNRDELERLVSKIDEEGFEIYYGKYVLELRIKGMNKGKAIARFIDGSDLVFFAGDDVTDEEAFAVMKDHITVKVGKGKTDARFRVKSTDQVKWLVSRLMEESDETFRSHK